MRKSKGHNQLRSYIPQVSFLNIEFSQIIFVFLVFGLFQCKIISNCFSESPLMRKFVKNGLHQLTHIKNSTTVLGILLYVICTLKKVIFSSSIMKETLNLIQFQQYFRQIGNIINSIGNLTHLMKIYWYFCEFIFFLKWKLFCKFEWTSAQTKTLFGIWWRCKRQSATVSLKKIAKCFTLYMQIQFFNFFSN